MKSGRGGLIFSTDRGRMCPQCRQALADCRCKATAPVPSGDGVAKVRLEKSGRGGKTVTTVRGLALATDPLVALGKQLRAACGSGGTAKDGVIEVQGDHAERVIALLQAAGHRAKRAGG